MSTTKSVKTNVVVLSTGDEMKNYFSFFFSFCISQSLRCNWKEGRTLVSCSELAILIWYSAKNISQQSDRNLRFLNERINNIVLNYLQQSSKMVYLRFSILNYVLLMVVICFVCESDLKIVKKNKKSSKFIPGRIPPGNFEYSGSIQ